MESLKNKIPVITGPTAVGKTEMSLILAENIGGEIINMDSRQVYREMNIGTAKPSAEELARVPHHLIDIVDPGDRYTVGDFVDDCNAAMEDIVSRGRVPIIVGGTPFYLAALMGDFNFCNVDSDMEYREELRARADAGEKETLHEELKKVDPESAERIHPNDVVRVIRALEIYRVAGRPASELRGRNSEASHVNETGRNNFHICALYIDREKLYDLINLRAGIMFDSGLVEETRMLLEARPGIREFIDSTIGYAQAAKEIDGEYSRAEAVEETSKQTRRFAKRQMTWFRSLEEATWMDRESMNPGIMAGVIAADIIINH